MTVIMSETDIGDMAAVGTVLVTGSLCEINQTGKLNHSYMPAYSNGGDKVKG